MAARWTRWPPASCRSRWARRRRPSPMSWTPRKTYRFTDHGSVRPRHRRRRGQVDGDERAAADATPRSRPLWPRFIGEIQQVPPRFAAIKIQGERAYDIARRGEEVELAAAAGPHRPRSSWSDAPIPITPSSEMACGKGAYVRAIARDLGEMLGCFAHVAALRRTAVGSFVAERRRSRWMPWSGSSRTNRCRRSWFR